MKHRLQKRPLLRKWIAIGLIIRLYQCKFRDVCTVLKTSREWSSNEISKLFLTEFNARVNWIRPTTRVGDKQSNQSFPRNFYAL